MTGFEAKLIEMENEIEMIQILLKGQRIKYKHIVRQKHTNKGVNTDIMNWCSNVSYISELQNLIPRHYFNEYIRIRDLGKEPEEDNLKNEIENEIVY
jgi:hypothetical protein